MADLILGIEVGGTKLQFGVGTRETADLVDFERCNVDRGRGAEGIREQIAEVGGRIARRNSVSRIGYGFGGPVDRKSGMVVTSHQVSGWFEFPLQKWTEETLGAPTVLANDCDAAALAEATIGAGQGHRTVFYVTVGTGIGGGLVINGELHGSDRPAVAEIGHLRPEPRADQPTLTVESCASGLGIETRAAAIEQPAGLKPDGQRIVSSNPTGRTCRQIATAASQGDSFATELLTSAATTLGWAIAQTITLIAPDVVIVGGGVPMMDKTLFLDPVRAAVDTYAFGPLRGQVPIVEPKLGERVVVHGAIINAANTQLLQPPA